MMPAVNGCGIVMSMVDTPTKEKAIFLDAFVNALFFMNEFGLEVSIN